MKKIIISLIVFGVSNSFANVKLIEEQYKACMDKANNNFAYNECSTKAYEKADANLNELYNSIRTPLMKSAATDADSEEILRRLVSSERAWITYRDSHCELEGTLMLRGSGEALIINACLAETTFERIKILERIFMEYN